MGFGQAIKSGFANYATFTGRARRAEFWLFYLFTVFVGIFGIGLVILTAVVAFSTVQPGSSPGAGPLIAYFIALGLYMIGMLALSIPIYAAWARRLHDMGQTGHWLWLNFASLGIVPLVMAFMDSQPGPNQWGPDPKAAERPAGYGYPQQGQPQYGQPQYGQPQYGQVPPPPQAQQPPTPQPPASPLPPAPPQ